MKRLVSFALIVSLLFSCSISAFAAEGSNDCKTISIEVEYSDNVGTSENLTFMQKDGNVYVSAIELATRLGYSISVQDECVAIYNTTSDEIPFGFTIFYFDSTEVKHTIFSQMIDDYEAPFQSIKEGADAWIPFEYSLLILGSAVSVIGDTFCIDIPEKSIVDVFYTAMNNFNEYNFDWEDDFGYSNLDIEVIGISSHIANLFNGILKFDGDSWAELFQAFALDSSAYESKYGEDLALLLCTESDKELAAETKKIQEYKDLLSADGKIGKMLSQYSENLDTDAEAWANTCETILNEVQSGNSSLAQYNKAYQALEKALDKQTWFSNTGGTILEVQRGVQSATPFLKAALTMLEVVGYAEEFGTQDEFSVAALGTVLTNLDEDALTFEAMQTSMSKYVKYLETDVATYSTMRLYDENLDSWISSALELTAQLGTQANIGLLAWNLISSFVPRISDSLSAADKFELAMYASVFAADIFINYQNIRNNVFSDEENITAENLYTVSQYCYTYLKSCCITRDAALASLKGKSASVQEQIQPLIDAQNAINEEIAELLVILKNANITNEDLVYGFLPSDNEVYLASDDSSALVAVIKDSSTSMLDSHVDLVEYIGTDLNEFITKFDLEYEDPSGGELGGFGPSGWGNDFVFVWNIFDETIYGVEIRGKCEYTVRGIEYGMSYSDVYNFMISEGMVYEGVVDPYVVGFSSEDGLFITVSPEISPENWGDTSWSSPENNNPVISITVINTNNILRDEGQNKADALSEEDALAIAEEKSGFYNEQIENDTYEIAVWSVGQTEFHGIISYAFQIRRINRTIEGAQFTQLVETVYVDVETGKAYWEAPIPGEWGEFNS